MARPLTGRRSFSKTCDAGSGAKLKRRSVRIDAYRRNLQRAYLDLLSEKLNGRAPVTDDQRPFIRGELRALNLTISASDGARD